jgi:preprotein translocase subunit YajC
MDQLIVFLPLLIVLGAFMFFASRRQKRALQATIDLHESLRIGDRVHTTSGLQATITRITDDTVDLEIAPGVVTTWMKLAIRDRIEPDVDQDASMEITEADATEPEGRRHPATEPEGRRHPATEPEGRRHPATEPDGRRHPATEPQGLRHPDTD